MKTLAYLALVGLVTSFTAQAAERQHGAHEHGAGKLNLAQEKDEVEIELEVPGDDIVGFEHAAKTDADRRAVDAAIKKLKDGASLFRFPAAAGCKLKEAEVAVHAEGEEGHGHKHEAKEGEHKHEKGKEAEGGHNEFHAHYHFQCANPAAASPLDVQIFAVFPSTQKLTVQAISPRGQNAATLTPQHHRFDF
ncbi:MAG: DUF2796 domain-containing protein [Rhodospirillaceae bacterium]